ncbi:protein of unknown function [Xenorhabdus poinarii G6]|uniref:Uncharacterized protein n=1 Tax=Xenorhabdus poinarii G6 TaxID=1354304 RepID=A0A068R6V7_9GAMM|nr:protein of unknown function [Xenorhabdus poinarii G6]
MIFAYIIDIAILFLLSIINLHDDGHIPLISFGCFLLIVADIPIFI